MGGVPTCSQTVGAPKKKKKDNGLQKKMVKLSVYGYYSICMYIYICIESILLGSIGMVCGGNQGDHLPQPKRTGLRRHSP